MSSFDYAGRRGPQLTIFFLILLSTLASAQDPLSVEDRRQPAASVPAQRPRIGLALSGGGALGLAQIGVIQWLERTTSPSTALPEPAWAASLASCTRQACRLRKCKNLPKALTGMRRCFPSPTTVSFPIAASKIAAITRSRRRWV